jgi:aspartate/glutamate racemase
MSQHNKKLHSFGVIGGIGPASTIRFLNLIIDKYRIGQGAILNSAFPQITIYIIPNAEHMSDELNRQSLQELT